MELFFENHCKYTYDYYLQLKRKTMDKGFNGTCYFFLALFIAFGVLTLVKGWHMFTIAAATGIIFVLFRLIGTPILLASFATKKNREVHGKDLDTVNSFFEDHLLAVNASSGSKTNIKYEDVKTVCETKNLIIIGMDKNLYLMLDKEGFTKGTLEEYRKFIKEKCVNGEVNI